MCVRDSSAVRCLWVVNGGWDIRIVPRRPDETAGTINNNNNMVDCVIFFVVTFEILFVQTLKKDVCPACISLIDRLLLASQTD